jgi:aminopeptidase C
MFDQLQNAFGQAMNEIQKDNSSQNGGASKVAKKREKLNKMTCDQLREKARKLKLAVTKKKDGKIVNIKKASLVAKILKHMVDHKMV